MENWYIIGQESNKYSMLLLQACITKYSFAFSVTCQRICLLSH